jgi:hypothetical protein
LRRLLVGFPESGLLRVVLGVLDHRVQAANFNRHTQSRMEVLEIYVRLVEVREVVYLFG